MAGGQAQSIKCLLYKNEGLNLIPRTLKKRKKRKKPGVVVYTSYSETKTEWSLGFPDQLAKSNQQASGWWKTLSRKTRWKTSAHDWLHPHSQLCNTTVSTQLYATHNTGNRRYKGWQRRKRRNPRPVAAASFSQLLLENGVPVFHCTSVLAMSSPTPESYRTSLCNRKNPKPDRFYRIIKCAAIN